ADQVRDQARLARGRAHVLGNGTNDRRLTLGLGPTGTPGISPRTTTRLHDGRGVIVVMVVIMIVVVIMGVRSLHRSLGRSLGLGGSLFGLRRRVLGGLRHLGLRLVVVGRRLVSHG